MRPFQQQAPRQGIRIPSEAAQNCRGVRTVGQLGALTLGLLWSCAAGAQGADIFHGADLKLGEQLIGQNHCAQCHAQRVGGDGSAIYRPQGRIQSAGLLRGMVEQCNASLNLQMFPEEVNAVAAVLNRDHYKFK